MAEEIVQDVKVIVFQLKNEEYAVPVTQVGSIEKMEHITRVPNTESFIKGVINMRGVVTPIVDLRSRLGLEETPVDENTRIIIVDLDDTSMGLIVDAANDVVDIPVDKIEEAPQVIGAINVDYIDGVVKLEDRLVILLDLRKVLKFHEIEAIKSIES
ncbi:chemotaxis protein CheW [Terribacillus saccharophilus]|jgi:purine-binding chemotaxis protein CheW|uniref:Chemotaxis protein CheW n=1 Tax=Terribacillus saccharophilus TaxID=361277 RepID=A0A1H8APQ9_9BACI|nr:MULTISPECIES: chemotaxis protein CheW [Terribacillus]MCM3224904.1 chemotaxis protein CheW [Terribacillus saccharophilus]MEC0283176.1 chemotaxis protein CheW [Terribacillus saccharophilus]MEC0290132.1 chemotaxis protein CheW [Terribacillus saccharophilus]MEC0304458.1 chemotaxis protein CheW [Terribacillus saccharophilus]PAD21122.1 chemotaxis protein CheW [Terribacillus saccharophilus]